MKKLNSKKTRRLRRPDFRSGNLGLILILALLLLITVLSCKDKDDPTPQKAPDPKYPVIEEPELKDQPHLNRFILTSKDEKLVKVDPNTGEHEVVFEFADYDDITSLDFLNGIVYAGSKDNSMNAIDLQSKQLLWDVPLLEYESSALASPKVVVKDGVCYATGIPGVLVAIEITTGKILWTYPLDPSGATDGYFSSVGRTTVTEDKVIVGTSESLLVNDARNHIHVIDKVTGKNIWKKELPSGVGLSGAMKLVGQKLLVPAHSLFALDISSGNVLWEFKMYELSRGVGSPAISGNKVLVQGAFDIAEGRLYCLDLNTGAKLWELDAGNDYAGVYSPLIVGNFVFGVYERGSAAQNTGNGKPFLAEITTGRLTWSSQEVSVSTSPVVANGRLYFHGSNFKLPGSIDNQVGFLCMEAATGKFLWLNNYFRYSSATAPLIVAENGIFKPSSMNSDR